MHKALRAARAGADGHNAHGAGIVQRCNGCMPGFMICRLSLGLRGDAGDLIHLVHIGENGGHQILHAHCLPSGIPCVEAGVIDDRFQRRAGEPFQEPCYGLCVYSLIHALGLQELGDDPRRFRNAGRQDLYGVIEPALARKRPRQAVHVVHSCYDKHIASLHAVYACLHGRKLFRITPACGKPVHVIQKDYGRSRLLGFPEHIPYHVYEPISALRLAQKVRRAPRLMQKSLRQHCLPHTGPAVQQNPMGRLRPQLRILLRISHDVANLPEHLLDVFIPVHIIKRDVVIPGIHRLHFILLIFFFLFLIVFIPIFIFVFQILYHNPMLFLFCTFLPSILHAVCLHAVCLHAVRLLAVRLLAVRLLAVRLLAVRLLRFALIHAFTAHFLFFHISFLIFTSQFFFELLEHLIQFSHDGFHIFCNSFFTCFVCHIVIHGIETHCHNH